MARTRIHNLSISLDGFAAGEGQALESPMGHAGQRLHEWMFATRFGAPILGRTQGSEGVDDAFAQQHEPGIGAEIMGAGKFGPPGWQDDADWKGWWGRNPPSAAACVCGTGSKPWRTATTSRRSRRPAASPT